MNFFHEHQTGCTPLNPCHNCKIVRFLETKLSEEDFEILSRMVVGSRLELEKDKLTRPIDGLNFSPRVIRCLKDMGINSVGELVLKTGNDLLRSPDLGRQSLNEIKEVLGSMGLSLSVSPKKM